MFSKDLFIGLCMNASWNLQVAIPEVVNLSFQSHPTPAIALLFKFASIGLFFVN